MAIAVALTAGMVGSAGAAKSGNGRKAGFAASALTYDDCDFGATCDADAAADRTGSQTTSSSIDQATTTLGSQSTYGLGRGATALTLSAPVPAVEITYVWRVDEAVTTATAGAIGDGRSAARVFLRGRVTHTGCPGCVVEDATDGYGIIAAESWAGGLGVLEDVAGPPAQAAPGEETLKIVVRGPNGGPVPAGRLDVSGSTLAFVYVGCPLVEGECREQSLGHAGAATASARTQLLRITHTATT